MYRKFNFIQDPTYSLLFYACQYECEWVFRLLALELGADVAWRNNRGTIVLQMIAKRNQVKKELRQKTFSSGSNKNVFIQVRFANVVWTALMGPPQSWIPWIRYSVNEVNLPMFILLSQCFIHLYSK